MRKILHSLLNFFKRRYLHPRFSFVQLQFFVIVAVTAGSVVGLTLLTNEYIIPRIRAAASPWTQTDWSGGVSANVVSGEVATYQSAVDVTTNQAGQISLAGQYTSIGTFSGNRLSNNSTDFNVSSWYAVQFNTAQTFNDATFSYDSGSPTRITVDASGDYFVSLTMPIHSDDVEDSGNRSAVKAEVRVNGVKVDVGRAQSAYIRNYTGHFESSNHLAVLLEGLSAGDYIEVFVAENASDGSSHTLTSDVTVYAEQVAVSEVIFNATATRTTSSTDLNQSSPAAMEWTHTTSDSGYTHTNGNHQVSLDEAGSYFVAVNIPFNSSGQRVSVQGKVLLDGVQIDGGQFKQGYIRNANNHSDGSIHWVGLVTTTSANQVLTITTQQEGANGTATTNGEKATLFVQKVPNETLFSARATQVGGANEWNPASKSSINWSSVDVNDSAVYEHSTSSNNHEITVLESGDYLLAFNAAYSSNGQRVNPKITVQVNGSDVSGAESSSGYIRASSGHNESSDSLLFPLLGLSANDVITVSVEPETSISNSTDDTTDAKVLLWRKGYASTGTVTSQVFDAGFPADWGTVTYNSTGGTTTVKVRSDSNSDMSGATDWNSCTGIASGSDISDSDCVTDATRYLQYQVELGLVSGTSPQFEDIAVEFVPSDVVNPTVNASGVGMVGANDGEWTKNEPTISWTAGADNDGGAGLLGYCIALDEADPSESNLLDPASSAGSLLSAIDDGVAESFCEYIVTTNSVDLSSLSGLSLTSGKQYFFSIKAVDIAGNVWSGASGDYQDLVSFKYDNTPPTNPAYFSLPGDFISTKSATLVWPSSGAGIASDAHSGLAGLQYRIGQNGTWYGSSHTGSQDSSDVLPNVGSYQFIEDPDYADIQEGSNIIYLRAIDSVGNVSSSYLSGALKINTSSPSTPLNLTVSPETNTSNEFAFEWDPPGTYTGQLENMTYCYTVNTLPTSTSCNWTDAAQTSLSADAYANQPGENTLYLVAKDEAGNVNYATYAFTTFTANTSAPGIPATIDIADVSVKATSSWKLAISWEEPVSIGAGVQNYEIYHSTDGSSFSKESTVTGISYVDTQLSQQTHYYKVRACDSANNCGAFTEVVELLPDGKFIEAPSLTSGPLVSNVTTKKATISWGTTRTSDSKVSYGVSSGDYFTEEPSNSTQVTDHQINLLNLSPGTTYHYKARWTDEDGNTGESDEQSFTTDPAPTVYDVEISNISVASAFINFTVAGASEVEIYYGESTAFGGVKKISTSTLESTYSVQLDGLLDGTKYYFKINAIDQEGDEYEGTTLDFITLPRPQISEVRLQQISGTAQPTVLVTWTTNTAISSIVTYYPVNDLASSRDEVDVNLKTGQHRAILTGLLPNTPYALVVKGRDIVGNEASSVPQTFSTASDTRAPLISGLNVEGYIVDSGTGSDRESLAQLVVSWNTDELSTSQVEFGEGTGTVYSQKTQEDGNLTFNHMVVISNLSPSKVYHLRAISKDSSGNARESVDTVTVTPKATNSALDLVTGNLTKIFGFLRR